MERGVPLEYILLMAVCLVALVKWDEQMASDHQLGPFSIILWLVFMGTTAGVFHLHLAGAVLSSTALAAITGPFLAATINWIFNKQDTKADPTNKDCLYSIVDHSEKESPSISNTTSAVQAQLAYSEKPEEVDPVPMPATRRSKRSREASPSVIEYAGRKNAKELERLSATSPDSNSSKESGSRR